MITTASGTTQPFASQMTQELDAAAPATTTASLRQRLAAMLDLLEDERRALTGLDLDAITGCAVTKAQWCDALDRTAPELIDEECLGLLDAAQRLNETNRRVRNLLAANVAARLDALTGAPAIYRAHSGAARAAHLLRHPR